MLGAGKEDMIYEGNSVIPAFSTITFIYCLPLPLKEKLPEVRDLVCLIQGSIPVPRIVNGTLEAHGKYLLSE